MVTILWFEQYKNSFCNYSNKYKFLLKFPTQYTPNTQKSKKDDPLWNIKLPGRLTSQAYVDSMT